MTFKEIIIAALKETDGELLSTLSQTQTRVWDWKWGDVKLDLYFTKRRPQECSIYETHQEFLCTIHEADLLDPSWSPATLAKQINAVLLVRRRTRGYE